MQVEVGPILDCFTSFFHPSAWEKTKDEYWHCPLLYYIVKKVGGELSTANFDEEEKEYADMAEWIDLEKVTGLKYHNGVGGKSADLINKAWEYNLT